MLQLNINLTKIAIVGGMILAIIVPIGPVSAQENSNQTNISAFPALFELNTKPGDEYKTNLVVVNQSNKPLPVELSVESLIPPEQIIDLSKRSQFDASRWVSLETSSLALEPNESKNVVITINSPKVALPGGQYAEVIIKELKLAQDTAPDTSAVIIPQIKVPLLINVAGQSKEELILEIGDKFPHYIGIGSRLKTNITVANTGTVHLLPAVKIDAIKNGQIVSSYTTSPGLVLPNTKRAFNIEWRPQLGLGFYDLKASVVYGSESRTLESGPEGT